MLLQRLHFLRRLIPNLTIYKLKERVGDSTRFFNLIMISAMGYGGLDLLYKEELKIEN